MIKINLLGEKPDHRGLYMLQGLLFGCIVVGCLVSCFVFHGHAAAQLELAQNDKAMLQTRLTKLKEKTKRVENLEKNKKLLGEKLNTIAKLKAKKQGPVHIMHDVTQAIPERAWLIAINQKGEALQFQGFALDNQTVSLFMNNLEKSDYFSAIDLVYSRQHRKEGVHMQQFALLAKLKNALDVKKNKPLPAEAPTADGKPAVSAEAAPESAAGKAVASAKEVAKKSADRSAKI